MLRRFWIFLLLFPSAVFAQFTEDFSDGNFTSNPTWTGDDSLFVIDAGELRSNSSGANTYYLSTPCTTATDAQWELYFNMKFSTSGSNYVDVYLISDVADLNVPNNGYFVRIGNTNDEISLYSISTGTESMIIDGTDDTINSGSTNPFNIKVTRDTANLWTLFYDDGATGTYVLEDTVTSNVVSTSSFFGIAIEQSTAAGPINSHYFDNINVSTIPVDSFPPTITSHNVISNIALDVYFNEPLNQASAETITNYTVDNAIGNPISAVLDPGDFTLVHLTFTNPFGNGDTNTITITSVSDGSGNSITVPETATFMFFVPETAALYDILINEIFADPSPVVGLPDAEFAELYNNSNKIIDLNGFYFSDNTNVLNLTGKILPPGGYLILCANGDTSSFKSFGAVMGVSSWSTLLNNAGDDMFLRDSDSNIIHTVSYTDDWYNNTFKDGGGWSLEMIDPSNPCAEESNWAASVNADGGTPGKQNSVYGSNPDTDSPVLVRADVLDSVNVQLTFDENLNSNGVDSAIYVINKGISVSLDSLLSPRTVKLTLSTELQKSTIYTVTVTGLDDCVGNTIGVNNTADFVFPEQGLVGDLIINEVLFNPRDNNSGTGSDFVEIYNNSTRYIDLAGWQLANWDKDTIDNLKSITANPYVIFPGNYVVLSKDIANIEYEYPLGIVETYLEMSSMPSYINGDGMVILISSVNTVIDSFSYDEDMHFVLLNDVNGVSLERLDFDRLTSDKTNWHSAAEAVGFATPGYLNSQYTPSSTSGEVSVNPEVFSPDNDGVDDVVNINYAFDDAGFVGSITIFDSNGRPVKYLIKNELLGTEGTFSWDGSNEISERARIGIYVVYFEVFGVNGEIKHFKKACVLGAKL